MSGVCERQQNGYECTMRALSTNRPEALIAAIRSLSASFTCCPANGAGTGETKHPLTSTGSGNAPPLTTIPCARQTRLSSSPYAGAWCTMPVPLSSVT